MADKSHKLFNAQSDIWDAHEPVDGSFTLLPVGVPDPITTSQEILLANSPIGGGEGYGTTTLWYPNPWNRVPTDAYVSFGTLLSGEDFFPFYRNGVFWYPRQIKSMVMNGLLFDSSDPDHRIAMALPSSSTKGFYQINLQFGPPATIFAAIRNLIAGQTLDITDITLATS